MAEIQRGGLYRVGDETVDATGKPATVKSKPAAAKTETPPEPTVYVEGVSFGSDAAGEAAKEYGLTADDFKDLKPSGVEGYTKPDVAKIIAAKEATKTK